LAMIYSALPRHPNHEHKIKLRHLSLLSEIKIAKRFFPQVFPFLVLGFGIGVYEAVFIIFGPIEFVRTSEVAGLLSALIMLANLFVPLFAVWLLHRFAEKVLISVSAITLLLVSVVYIATTDTSIVALMLFLSFSLLALIFLAKDSAFLNILNMFATSEEEEAVSISSLGPNVAYVIVGIVGGVVMQSLGFNTAVILAAVTLLVSVIIFLVFRPNATSGASTKMYS